MQILVTNQQTFQVSNNQSYSSVVFMRYKKLQDYEKLINEGASQYSVLEVLSISRATLYRWKRRYKQEGLRGLEDDSRSP